jgi:hypothetical protein
LATVRTPQPEKKSLSSSAAATTAPRSGATMPDQSAWPGLLVRTRHGALRPSSARA